MTLIGLFFLLLLSYYPGVSNASIASVPWLTPLSTALSRILRSMRDSGSPRRSGSSESGIAAPDDDKYNKPRRPDEERLWLGMPVSILQERVSVLAILMVFQSASGMILSRFEDMLQKHVVVTLFLTMLVGAGGNAGNQSTVNIIRGLATGQVNNSNASSVVLVEAKLGLALGLVLAMLGWARVMITDGDSVSAMAIGAPRPAPSACKPGWRAAAAPHHTQVRRSSASSPPRPSSARRYLSCCTVVASTQRTQGPPYRCSWISSA